jgi:hypothetical protein
MADYFYAVGLSRNEELARTPSYVDKFLVELVCEDHRTENSYESDRENSAFEIAVDATKRRYGLVGTENIGYKRVNRYGGRIPANLGEVAGAQTHAMPAYQNRQEKATPSGIRRISYHDTLPFSKNALDRTRTCELLTTSRFGR